MIKAVIFDFDGVIADSEEIHYRAFVEVLEPYGIHLDHKVYWDTYLGYNDRDAYRHINADNGNVLSEEQIDWLIDEKAVVFDEIIRRDGVIIDGVFEFLKMLKDNSIPMAICSGASWMDIENVFKATEKRTGCDLAKAFKVIVSADDVIKGKPHPEGYLLALNKLNSILGQEIQPSECLVIEDSHWGIEAGKAAGMKVLAVTNSYPREQLEKAADTVVDTLKTLCITDISGGFDTK